MKRLGSLLLTGALALSLWVLPAGAAEPEDTLAETAHAAALAAQQYGGAQSVQYALWQDGEIILTGHAGDYSRTENRVLTDDILYGIGSVSKVYTTAAILKLSDQGKLRLDAPVAAYLPDFTMADARYKDITVRMLLNHSSGLNGSTMAYEPAQRVQKPGTPVQNAGSAHRDVGAQPDHQSGGGGHRRRPAQYEEGAVQHRADQHLTHPGPAVGGQLQSIG